MPRLASFAVLLLCVSAHATTPPPYQYVLVPISVDRMPGVNGSLWTTELWITNGSDEPAAIAAIPCPVGVTVLCADQTIIPPNRSRQLPPVGNGHFPGFLLLVPTWLESRISFSLHVRDLSQQGSAWGTEVPVVPARLFFSGARTFTGIASGADYRQTLRLYALNAARLRVQLYAIAGSEDRLLRDEVVTLAPHPPPPPNMLGTPLAQATFADFFAVDAGTADRLRLTVTPLEPVVWWGLISVTNNRTQHVTTVTAR